MAALLFEHETCVSKQIRAALARGLAHAHAHTHTEQPEACTERSLDAC